MYFMENECTVKAKSLKFYERLENSMALIENMENIGK